MESGFRHDFSRVRVHTDTGAAASADAMNAVAFASGQHIVFGSGQYAPQTPRGRHALAHELAHTVQAAGASHPAEVRRIPKDPQNVPFEGEIIPSSATLHARPERDGKVLAELSQGHVVTVRGGHAWIQVEAFVGGKKLTGYVSHELIRQRAVPASKTPDSPAEKAADKTAKAVMNATPAGQAPADAGTKLEAPVTDSANLTKLRKLLDMWDVPEEEVIALMGALSPGEVTTVALSGWYKWHAASAFDKDEMISALNTMRLQGHVRREWMKAGGVPIFEIEFQDDFHGNLNGVSLDGELWRRIMQMCQLVIDYYLAGENLRFSEGVRSRPTAHKWSTAYNIRLGNIPLDRLKVLPGGKDADGNLWWKNGWSQSDAAANANVLWSGATAFEGYPSGDPRRLPNTDNIAMSEHCPGRAVDVKINWRNGGGWNAMANWVTKKSGLKRPISNEPWHFEVGP